MAKHIDTTLTIKQQNFCHEYIQNGGNGQDAYLTAYNTTSKGAAKVEACKLLQRDDITAYIQALTKPSQNQAINERQRKRQWLWNVVHDETQATSDRLRAMDILNKLDQDYVNVTRDDTEKSDISNLDNDTLLKLVSN